MHKLNYHTTTDLPGRDGPQPNSGESPTDIALDHASQRIPHSVWPPSFDDSIPRGEEAGSAAGVVVTRLLSVLVVAMVVTSILGFTLFDRQGGNSAAALASLAIGVFGIDGGLTVSGDGVLIA